MTVSLETISERMFEAHETLADVAVWGLYFIVGAWVAVFGHALVADGAMTAETARTLQRPLSWMVLFACLGFGTYIAGLVFGLAAYVRETQEGDSA
jgi:hypothetical protein